MTPPDLVTTASVTAGKLTIHGRQQFLTAIAGLREGEYLVKVERVKTTRSRDQNAYLHAVPFPILADHFGNSIEEIKYALMGECFGWHRDPVSGKEIPIKPSTSSMTVEEASYFIDWIVPWAAVEHGVLLPLPNEPTSAEPRTDHADDV